MDVLLNIVNYILGFGAAVFVPLIMLIIGLIVKMSFKDAFFAALTLGIAFTGMNVLINFMTGAITPAAQGLAEATGISLPAVDVGWPALSAIAWAWPLGVLCFPLLMVINLIMLLLKLTDTLNVDFWNCWTKLLTTVLTYYLCAAAGMPEGVAIAMGFVAASVQIILELKIGDAFQPTIERITGIPGVTVPHAMMLTATVAYPIERLLEKIPAIENNNADAKWLRKKIGIFGENAVMGFIIGTAMGAIAYRDVQQALTLGVQAATALQLFPMVSNGNIIKMLIEGIIITPVYLLVSSSFAPWVTQLALTYSPDSLANVGGDALISWSTLECPDFRWAIANAFSGNVAGIAVLVGWLALFVWMLRGFKKRNEALKASE